MVEIKDRNYNTRKLVLKCKWNETLELLPIPSVVQIVSVVYRTTTITKDKNT